MDSRRSEGIRASFPLFVCLQRFSFRCLSSLIVRRCPKCSPIVEGFARKSSQGQQKRTRGGQKGRRRREMGGPLHSSLLFLPLSRSLLLLPLIRSYLRRRGRSSSNLWSDLPAKSLWDTETLRNEEKHSSRER